MSERQRKEDSIGAALKLITGPGPGSSVTALSPASRHEGQRETGKSHGAMTLRSFWLPASCTSLLIITTLGAGRWGGGRWVVGAARCFIQCGLRQVVVGAGWWALGVA